LCAEPGGSIGAAAADELRVSGQGKDQAQDDHGSEQSCPGPSQLFLHFLLLLVLREFGSQKIALSLVFNSSIGITGPAPGTQLLAVGAKIPAATPSDTT
jgi:hypothetical protein